MNQGDIALPVREKPLHVRQVAFHRRDALADLAHFLPHGVVSRIVRSCSSAGFPTLALMASAWPGADTEGVDIDCRQHMIRPVRAARELSGCPSVHRRGGASGCRPHRRRHCRPSSWRSVGKRRVASAPARLRLAIAAYPVARPRTLEDLAAHQAGALPCDVAAPHAGFFHIVFGFVHDAQPYSVERPDGKRAA